MAKSYVRKSTPVAAPPRDVHQLITDQMIALMEKGVRPWSKSWRGTDALVRPLKADGKPYQGVNVLILWMTARLNGYASPFWLTYNRAQALGGQVRKGEKSTMVVLYKSITVEKDGEERKIPILRGFSVFNASQIDGLPAKYYAEPGIAEAPANPHARIPQVDAFFEALGCSVIHGGAVASYNPMLHRINLPKFEDFFSAEAYYSTRGHETIHWTGHPTLADRNLTGRFGDDAYAMEELIAELGAAFLAADLGVENTPREDHASYLEHWLTVLRGDKKAIFTAASQADKAVKLLHTIANPAVVVDDENLEQAA
jgi:antirestriction protein ArdC